MHFLNLKFDTRNVRYASTMTLAVLLCMLSLNANARAAEPSATPAQVAAPTSPTPTPAQTSAPASGGSTVSPSGSPSPADITTQASDTHEPATQTDSPAPPTDGPIRFYRKRSYPEAEKKSYDGYLGIEGGLAIASGTYLPLNSGVAYGIDVGIDTPVIGYGFIARHELLSIWNTDSKESITQLMLELNIFSYLLLNGGIQFGDIITSTNGDINNSLGLGVHVGFDLHVTKTLTAGLGAYWTYVTENSDKHSLFNIMIPLKYWF